MWKLFKTVYDICDLDFMTKDEILDNNNYDI